MIFHKHKWGIVSTDYTEPQSFSASRISPEMADGFRCGTTHIYMKCKGCGDIRQKDVVGKFIDKI